MISIHVLRLICFDGDPCFEIGKVVNGYVAMLTIPPPALYFKGFKGKTILGLVAI